MAQGQLDNEFSFNINKWQPGPIVTDQMVDADALGFYSIAPLKITFTPYDT